VSELNKETRRISRGGKQIHCTILSIETYEEVASLVLHFFYFLLGSLASFSLSVAMCLACLARLRQCRAFFSCGVSLALFVLTSTSVLIVLINFVGQWQAGCLSAYLLF
jgi:hypothetical protein